MTAASSARIATPCMPGTHDQAPAALPSSDTIVADQSGVDPAEIEFPNGVDPTESRATELHTAAARGILKAMYAARMAGQTYYARLRRWPGFLPSGPRNLISGYLAWWLISTSRHRTGCTRGTIQQLPTPRVRCGFTRMRIMLDAHRHNGQQREQSCFFLAQGDRIPLSFFSTRQSCVSKSTFKADSVAMDTSLRTPTLPPMLIIERYAEPLELRSLGITRACC